jgi:hypothetical protein
MLMTKTLMSLIVCVPAMVLAEDQATDAARRLELLRQTKFLWLPDFSGTAETFRADDDPMSVQLVVLRDKRQGKSGVSADGQVIFVRMADKSKAQRFIEESFTRRLKAQGYAY